jgi:hypothetical protein
MNTNQTTNHLKDRQGKPPTKTAIKKAWAKWNKSKTVNGLSDNDFALIYFDLFGKFPSLN